MLQVLLQGRVVELSQELRLGRGVDLPNLLNQLTFGHGVFTFATVPGWSGDAVNSAD